MIFNQGDVFSFIHSFLLYWTFRLLPVCLFWFCHCRSTIRSISHTQIFSSFVFFSFGWCFSKFLWNIKVTINNSAVAIQDCEKLTGLWCQTSWSQWNDSKFALGPPKANTPHGLWPFDFRSAVLNGELGWGEITPLFLPI